MIALHLDEQRTWRGGEQQASWLVQGLVAAGHRVIIVGRPESLWLADPHGGAALERIALPLRNEFDLVSAWKLARIVTGEGVDIIHAHTSHAHSIACLARKMAGRGKVVVHRRVSFAPKGDPINRLKYAAPDRIVAVSGAVAQVLLGAGIAQGRVRTVHSAVDLARLDVPALTREALGVPPDVPLFFSAGALVGHKDHACLIDAMATLHAQAPEARLLIAGEGELQKALQRMIDEKGVSDHVKLLGHVTDMPAFFNSLDVFVFTSLYEGSANTLIETLQYGVPTIAWDVSSNPEIVVDGVTGKLVKDFDVKKVAEEIKQLTSGSNQNLIEQGIAKVNAEFDTNKNLKILENIL